MAYVKNIWVDQDVERPKTYEVTNNQDGSITLTDSFGLVTELGTPVNEVNMNHIEDGIAGCAIRKHNLTETFALGEWVLGGTGDDEGIYKSLIAENVGNAITDDTAWEKVEMGGGALRNIGEIVASTIPLTDAGLHLLDGALIQYGSYQAFVDYIAGLVTDYPDLFVTESDWQTAISTYGVCGKFVYDSVNNTVRLPKYSNKIYTKDIMSTAPVIGNGMTLGLSYSNNGTGGLYASDTERVYDLVVSPNAYGTSLGTSGLASSVVRNQSIGVTSDPTKSGLSAQLSNITTSLDGYYYIVIATSIKTDIEVDIDEIATDLNSKVDKSDLQEVQCVVETFSNGNSWGWVRSDGWCEQGGKLDVGAVAGQYTITFVKPFSNIQYSISTTCERTDASYNPLAIPIYAQKTQSSMALACNQYVGSVYWEVKGYIEV